MTGEVIWFDYLNAIRKCGNHLEVLIFRHLDMGFHPANLVFRFILELLALIGSGWWAYHQLTGVWSYVLVAIVPLLLAGVWGVFAVPGDASRSGAALIPIPGLIRLMLEGAIFVFAIWCIYDLGQSSLAWWYAVALMLHYSLSFDRIKWLIQQ